MSTNEGGPRPQTHKEKLQEAVTEVEMIITPRHPNATKEQIGFLANDLMDCIAKGVPIEGKVYERISDIPPETIEKKLQDW
jgi:hypothetical protein